MDKEDLILQEIQEVKAWLEKLNNRTRSLEIWRGYIVGIGTAVAFGVGFVLTIIFKIIGGE
jgi:hypothetical protein